MPPTLLTGTKSEYIRVVVDSLSTVAGMSDTNTLTLSLGIFCSSVWLIVPLTFTYWVEKSKLLTYVVSIVNSSYAKVAHSE
jgi:hypothetical protein